MGYPGSDESPMLQFSVRVVGPRAGYVLSLFCWGNVAHVTLVRESPPASSMRLTILPIDPVEGAERARSRRGSSTPGFALRTFVIVMPLPIPHYSSHP